eukprot:CAMPEP_0198612318 /NCGR_PEP_ID=MMETSP1462-20131121/157835_1 /TAXON_ID=1333877 /ORGANISM="Brandtodinium nutriculum, Strain RCC3387" /LENGTH=58 /DNA_ID=CAMNT_0044344121 /DNA_START=232 /DNA_END=408 /DNA_ORIENTATION=-
MRNRGQRTYSSLASNFVAGLPFLSYDLPDGVDWVTVRQGGPARTGSASAAKTNMWNQC